MKPAATARGRKRLTPRLAGLALLLVAVGHARAQEYTNRPTIWKANSFLLGASMDIGRVELPHNTTSAVRAEILDPHLLRVIAAANDLSTQDIAGLRLYQNPENRVVELYRLEASLRAFNVVNDRLKAYIDGRKEGHTREYMTAALTNKSILHFNQADDDLRYLLVARPMIPEAMIKKYAAGTETNRPPRVIGHVNIDDPPATNLISRWTAYAVVDGPVAWGYYLHFKPNNTFDYLEELKCDAIELDPKFAPLLKEVDAPIVAQMKRDHTDQGRDALHTFWRLRQQRLKERGLDWHTPAELNPHIRYE